MELNNSHITERSYYEDEISLTDLILIVWRNRWVAIVSGAMVLLLAILYLFVANPVYKSEAYILPPLEQDIAELNSAKRFNFLGYDTKQVFEEFIVLAKSRESRRQFFDQKGLFEYFTGDRKNAIVEQVFERQFNDKLIISMPAKDSNSFTTIMFENGSSDKAALIINEFIEYISNLTRSRLIANVNSDIRAAEQEYATKIEGKRKIAQQRREDSIAQLGEALTIARKLGISRSLDYNRDLTGVTSDERLSVITTTTNQPLYTRGSIALEAEIEVLSQRKSDDPHIEGLRDLQETLSSIQEISIKPDLIQVINIDQPALVPYKPIKPKKSLVLAVGVLLGGFIGLFATFVWVFVVNLRKQLMESESK